MVSGAGLASAILATPLAAPPSRSAACMSGRGIGADLPQNTKVTPASPRGWLAPPTEASTTRAGRTASAAIGYGLGKGFRFEVQGDFFRNGLSQLALNAVSRLPPAATLPRDGVMANALFDLDIGTPYVPVSGRRRRLYVEPPERASRSLAGRSRSAATRPKAGSPGRQSPACRSRIPNMPGLSLTADYRFIDITAGAKFSGPETTAAGTGIGRIKLGPQFDHSFLIGVRYAFNAPPPAPPPVAAAAAAAPAPAPARSVLVFFDWDKATLTDRARQIIRQAADASTHVQTTRIEVNGYTDTSGSPQYNMGLSMRRADAVAAELVRDGVPRNVIAIHGFGETHLLVPTGPDVREPQNRRVEIIIR